MSNRRATDWQPALRRYSVAATARSGSDGSVSKIVIWRRFSSPASCWLGICHSAFSKATRRLCWRSSVASPANGPRPDFLSQMAAPGERLHQRHQRRNSGALARILALRLMQRDLHHVEIRAAGKGPAHLEPIELRHLRNAVSWFPKLSPA